MINASITAYSTAVGPSSETMNCRTPLIKRFIEQFPSEVACAQAGHHGGRKSAGGSAAQSQHVGPKFIPDILLEHTKYRRDDLRISAPSENLVPNSAWSNDGRQFRRMALPAPPAANRVAVSA
jgi:hypothetical protein